VSRELGRSDEFQSTPCAVQCLLGTTAGQLSRLVTSLAGRLSTLHETGKSESRPPQEENKRVGCSPARLTLAGQQPGRVSELL
jgi:hypothetical protein